MILNNTLSSRRHRRVLLALLILVIAASLTFTLYQPRPNWKHESRKAIYGLDNSEKPITPENNEWKGKTRAIEINIPPATWTCTDDDLPTEEKNTKRNRRSRQCVVRAFIRSNGLLAKNMPKVNLMSSDESSDILWQPRVEWSWQRQMKAHYVNETLFVHGLYSPSHFSHWLYNGMTPLYSTMKRFGGTKTSWLFRGAKVDWGLTQQGGWEMDHFFYTGKELVLSQYEIASDFQSLPPADAPICFERAVVGLGSQCALEFCENNIPTEVYQKFRDEIAEHYWNTTQSWQDHIADSRIIINQEQLDKDNNEARSPLRCLEGARYYNFEGAGPSHGLETSELSARIGQRFPDTSDPAADYKVFSPDGSSSSATSVNARKLVIGIIQRAPSRKLLNDQDLVEGLVKAGFRVKWMTFDRGCGLAETAYLLRDVNVLISPHGNAIGASIFMPTHDPVPTIISIDNSHYAENWFKFTTSVLGQRFMSSACGPHAYADEATKERCPYYNDRAVGMKLLQKQAFVLGLSPELVTTDEQNKAMSQRERSQRIQHQRAYVKANDAARKLAEAEFETLIGAEVPYGLVKKYGEEIWTFFYDFWKGVPRYADVARVVKFAQGLQADYEREKSEDASVDGPRSNRDYIDYVRKNQACGVNECPRILQRNVASAKSAYGKHSVNNVGLWGQPVAGCEALLVDLKDFQDWKFDVPL
ncbi:hypothetical protein BGZ82_005205 [Podila clonocystis]|nr:hypothetical protein BGZ82_005205 [Podila clonocystis]